MNHLYYALRGFQIHSKLRATGLDQQSASPRYLAAVNIHLAAVNIHQLLCKNMSAIMQQAMHEKLTNSARSNSRRYSVAQMQRTA